MFEPKLGCDSGPDRVLVYFFFGTKSCGYISLVLVDGRKEGRREWNGMEWKGIERNGKEKEKKASESKN